METAMGRAEVANGSTEERMACGRKGCSLCGGRVGAMNVRVAVDGKLIAVCAKCVGKHGKRAFVDATCKRMGLW